MDVIRASVATCVAAVRRSLDLAPLPRSRCHVVVVADGCRDGTAAAARRSGAHVVEVPRVGVGPRGPRVRSTRSACSAARTARPAPPTAGGHPHVHGANLGVRASAYLHAGGFPGLETGEDHALVERLAGRGHPVHRPADLPVRTSARRTFRAPNGFGQLLDDLERDAV